MDKSRLKSGYDDWVKNKVIEALANVDDRDVRFYRVFLKLGASHELAASLVWGES